MNDEADYLSGLIPNPAYGGGCFLRVWAMQRLAPDRLRVAMEDPFHALMLTIAHDDSIVTGVEADWIRHPLSSCTGAAAFLSGMAGTPLVAGILSAGRETDAASHCTHMFDSFRLGVAHIAQRWPDRRYDILLPDRLEGPQTARLLIDGKERLSLTLAPDMTILSPADLVGAPLLRGFARWAKDRISRDQFAHLFMLQRAIFVSWGRKVDMARYRGGPAAIAGPPPGSCYAAQPARYADATRVGQERADLTRQTALSFCPVVTPPPAS